MEEIISRETAINGLNLYCERPCDSCIFKGAECEVYEEMEDEEIIRQYNMIKSEIEVA